jgi:GNAT superfamily N-acetyltransferase
MAGELKLVWDKSPASLAAAAAFAARVIGGDTVYISHGEIQTGLSDDGKTWPTDLAARYADDFADPGDARDLLLAHDAEGVLCGIAILAFEATSRRRFAVIEDMAVEPARRSLGIGAALLAELDRAVRARGIEWVFLESGLQNHRAHAFFERSGFETVSHVFAKRLPK